MSLLKAFERNIDRGPQFEVKSLRGVVSADLIREQATIARLESLEKRADKYSDITQVVTSRLNDLEKRLEASIKNFNSYADVSKRMQKYYVDLAVAMALDPIEVVERERIVIPDELKYQKGDKGKPHNRGAGIVQRRWTIWKAQYETGMSINQIAKDWDCDHGSILYAKSKNWVSTGKGWHHSHPRRKSRLK
ncbi:MAG: hypothetical protein EBU96_07885 [Actinobacteria bacterium]|nr:hypothetical protein [Actinomycetota bacterium]